LLFVSSIAIFVVLRVIPGDPTEIRATQAGVTAEVLAEQRKELGLDKPIPEQYVIWITGVLRGDFGTSYFSGFSTARLIGARIGPTVELTLVSVALGLLFAVPAATASAMRPESRLDRALSALAAAGVAIPSFWLGILLIAMFSVRLGWFPTRGYASFLADPLANLRFLALPALTLAVLLGSMFFRFLRSSMLETLSADFIRTAQGKGLIWRAVVIRHALPNGFLPTLTFVGLITGTILSGVVVIEFLFGWPGLGALAVDSVSKRDYPVLQGIAVVAAMGFLLTTLIVDLLSFALDPRLRVSRDN
jgi:peptide/nickel transport system permease protein